MPKVYKIKSRNDENKSSIVSDASLRKIKTVFEDQVLALTRGNVMNNVKSKIANTGFETLRRISERLSPASIIINCREDQMAPFFEPSVDIGSPGFFVVKKGVRNFKQKGNDKRANELTEMISQTGFFYDAEREDDFSDFGKMFMRELMVVDQVAVELQYNKKSEVVAFWLVDGTTIHRCTAEGWQDNAKLAFVQEIDGQVRAAYTHEEMIFDYKFKRVDLRHRGYGWSYLEQAIDLVTTLILGLNYNRNLFTEDKVPKGFIALQGEADEATIDAITRYWQMAMSGVNGRFNIPVIPSGKEGTSMDFKTLGQSNRDMEYSKMMYFFMSLFAAVFGMDLAEVGIKLDQSQNVLSETKLDGRQEFSKDRALKSMLAFMRVFMNKIVRKIDPDYEFVFFGIDPEDEMRKYEVATKAIGSISTINEMRDENGKPKMEGEEYDTVLNPQLIQLKAQLTQAKQAEEMQQQGDNQEDDDYPENNEDDEDYTEEDEEEDEDSDAVEKSVRSLNKHLEELKKSGYKIEVEL